VRMRLWSVVSDWERFAERKEANLLDEHAQLLLSDRLAEARTLQAVQDQDLAALMALAEEVFLAVAPVELSRDSLARIRRLAERAWDEADLERIMAGVRLPGRNTVLGAAIVGTAAVSLGRFALSYHRKRQEHVSSPN